MIYSFTNKYSIESVFESAHALWGLERDEIFKKGRSTKKLTLCKRAMIASVQEIFKPSKEELPQMFDISRKMIWYHLEEHSVSMILDDYESKRYQENFSALKEMIKQREII